VEISPKRPSQKAVTYLMRMGDERILAPLAAFFPDMFGLEGNQLFHRSEKFVSDPTDPNDDDYLERTMSRHELVHSVFTAVTCLIPNGMYRVAQKCANYLTNYSGYFREESNQSGGLTVLGHPVRARRAMVSFVAFNRSLQSSVVHLTTVS